ncbi:MAG: RICIN domain-containing protein [Candidatus Promineofilum sp.]|nr:RICIN domain-containing protein [Promineifilum sp.]
MDATIMTVTGWLLKKASEQVVNRAVDHAIAKTGVFEATCPRCRNTISRVEIPEGQVYPLVCPRCRHTETILIESVGSMTIHSIGHANILVQSASIVIAQQVKGPQYFHIVAKHSDKCLDVQNASKANGANVFQYSCHGGDNQLWQLVDFGNDYYQIRAKHSGKCLDVQDWSKVNGANVFQYECHGGDNQLWQLIEFGNRYFQIRAKHSGKCLDVQGWSKVNGANVFQYECHGGDNQLWRLDNP